MRPRALGTARPFPASGPTSLEAASLLSFLLLLAGGPAGAETIPTHALTATQLAGARVAVGGASSQVQLSPDGGAALTSLDIGRLLHLGLLSRRTDFEMMPEDLVRNRMGDSYAAALEALGPLGEPDSLLLRRLAAALEGEVRYLVYCRIVADRTLEADEVTSNTPIDQGVVQDRYDHSSERQVTGVFSIYDLTSGAMVWREEHKQEQTNRRTTYGRAQKLDVLPVSSHSFDQPCVSPDEHSKLPATREVLESLFLEFASSLPRRE